jgi:aspartate/methionine/tyrosine aminotransferase
MHICLFFEDHVLIRTGYPTYTSVTNLVGAVPVYYDLKEGNQWEPDFEALEQINQGKIMWIGYPHMPTELVELELFKLFCCKT